MNAVHFMGRLTADPELRKTTDGTSVCNFRLAIPYYRNGKELVDYFDFTTWRSNAENLCKYCRKGSQIAVVGSIHNETYTTKDGDKRYTVRVEAREIHFGAAPAAPAAPMNLDDFEELPTEASEMYKNPPF